MADTKIEWADKVLEVTGGCTKCSPGCTNCWAIEEVWRMAHNPKLGTKWQGLVEKKNGVLNWTGKIECFYEALDKLRKKPTNYFIASKSDLFHEKVTIGFLTHVFDTIKQCHQHTFLILTKRPKQALKMMWGKHGEGWRYFGKGDFHPNIHFGVSISNQAEADEKIPVLLQIPAAVRFLSIEPMLGPVDFVNGIKEPDGSDWWNGFLMGTNEGIANHLHGVIVGGESGKGARPMHPRWVRSIRKQCVATGVKFYFKQWGEWGIFGPNQHFDVLHWRTKKITDAYKKLYKTDCCSLGCTDGSMPTSGPVELIKRNIKVEIVTLEGKIVDDGFPHGAVEMGRITKKKAGRLLDGRIWEQLPERR